MSALDSFARIPRVLAILSRHPDGLALSVVAKELAVDEKQLRYDILQYYSAEIPATALLGLTRSDAIEFLAADTDQDQDPMTAARVRAVSNRPAGELGIEYLRADQLASLYEAASSLLETEPTNDLLAEAVKVLAGSFLGEAEVVASPQACSVVATVRDGLNQKRELEIEYSRAWRPGGSTRTVHPYALRHTRRGWEVDAGPLAEDGHTRTFLVSRISRATKLETSFTPPTDVMELLEAERTETPVELILPQRTQWVLDRFAETTILVSADVDDVNAIGNFLPPVSERVGLVLAIAGPAAFVVEPDSLQNAGVDLAHRLLAHHGLNKS